MNIPQAHRWPARHRRRQATASDQART
uniref:Uncharacterized protein n=1 Tax=Arundo donax TaxID=35708 RepID=A0A0A9H4D6_ARUDO